MYGFVGEAVWHSGDDLIDMPACQYSKRMNVPARHAKGVWTECMREWVRKKDGGQD